jgi:hypothetical protein
MTRRRVACEAAFLDAGEPKNRHVFAPKVKPAGGVEPARRPARLDHGLEHKPRTDCYVARDRGDRELTV